MVTRTIADAKAHLSSCVASAEAGEPVLLTRHGRPVAAMINTQDWERLQALKASHKRGLMALVDGSESGDAWAEQIDRIMATRSSVRSLPDGE